MISLQQVLEVIWVYLPAYFANASPVIFGGGGPIDAGLKWLDGKPLLGSHKTIRGTFFGIIVGTIVGVVQGNPIGGLLQSFGAILGDILFSFFKRRLNMQPGDSLPLVDQLDFIVIAVFLSYPIQQTPIMQIITIVILTLPLHYMVNIIAWVFKLKKNPW